MDGLPPTLMPDRVWQRTLKAPIGCVGVGLHTGRRVSLTLRPAHAEHGIVFRRTDLSREIPALWDWVVDTRLSTVVGDERWASARVGTVEHLMAALSTAGIDNALIELDGPEVPALDGSAAPFVFLIDCAGSVDLAAPRAVIEVRRTVRVSEGNSYVELQPATPGTCGLDMALSIDFAAEAIGRQSLALRLTAASFRQELAAARTFALMEEVDQLRTAGFAQGGSLDNAVVVDGHRVLNPGGLRMSDEFARHKLLDAVGDLALAGAPLVGRYSAHRPGHSLNNRLLRTLLGDSSAWRPAGRVMAAAAA